jgi:hypothetical protein
MKKLLLLLFFAVSFLQKNTAQSDACSAICLPTSGSISGSNINGGTLPTTICGGGSTTTNGIKFYTFTASSTSISFTFAASSCVNAAGFPVTGSLQCAILGGPDCGSTTPLACGDFVTGTLSAPLIPCKQYWVAVGQIGENVCNFSITYDGTKLLSTAPSPVVTGPNNICMGTEQTYCATLSGGCSPSGYTWTTQPTGKAIITADDNTGCATVKWTSSGNFKICAKPKFLVKCTPATINTTCFDVTVFELKPSNCTVTLCPEDQPYDFLLKPCILSANPTAVGTPDPLEFTVQQAPGTTKSIVIPYEMKPSGCQGKVNLIAVVKGKAIKSLPPILICEGDSVKIYNKYFSCANAQNGIQNIVGMFSPHPTVCDTQYNFVLQCIKIAPQILPTNPFIDCINTSVVLDAGNTTFLPAPTSTGVGVKSYFWTTSGGNMLGSKTNPSITATAPGVYTVLISYTYTLNTAQGSVTKTCTRVLSTTVSGGVGAVPSPMLVDVTQFHTATNPSKFKVQPIIPLTTYKWKITGGTPATAQGDSISIVWGTAAFKEVCVTAENICGVSKSTCKDITLSSSSSGKIVGSTKFCGSDTATYQLTNIVLSSKATLVWFVSPNGQVIQQKDSTAKVVWNSSNANASVKVEIKGIANPPIIDSLKVAVFPAAKIQIAFKYKFLIASATTGIQWYYNGKPIAKATGKYYIPKLKGVYYAKLTDANGCTAISNFITFNSFKDDDSGWVNKSIKIENTLENDDEIIAFPNPFTQNLTILVNNTTTEKNIRIINAMGQLIKDEKLDADELLIDTNDWLPGIYFLQVKNNQGEIIALRKINKI